MNINLSVFYEQVLGVNINLPFFGLFSVGHLRRTWFSAA
jgi:hypothetical protein